MDSILIPVPIEQYWNSMRSIIRQEINSLTFPKESKQEQYLSRRQISDLLKISLPTLGSYVKMGKLKAYRIGRRIRFKQSEIGQALKLIQTGLLNTNDNQTKQRPGVSFGE